MGAADITKLKANGYYTVAVSVLRILVLIMVVAVVLTRSVRSRSNTQNLTQSQRFQRGEGREDQGGYC